jgi:tetratricopeptide (TPR) repeat protein
LVDGHETVGRYIDEAAYTLFASAAEAEARGQLRAARDLYSAAARADDESAEILVRLGAVECALGLDPRASFAEAERLDPTYEPVHYERARCHLARGEFAPALVATERARALDPARPETSLLRAAALERLGRVDEARSELMAEIARRPSSRAAWTAVVGLAERHHDRDLADYARAQSTKLAEHFGAATPTSAAAGPPRLTRLVELDAALGGGELNEARRIAAREHLTRSELAVRAAALGRAADARALAELVARADPTDSSARIALATAAELEHDEGALAVALDAIPRLTTSPSPLARLLFAELLARWIDADAAREWLGRGDAPIAEPDPLLDRTGQRVRTALAQ